MGFSKKNIGFSSGALFGSNYMAAIKLLKSQKIKTIELSTLREHELEPFISKLDILDLSSFDYISFHAPSKLIDLTERKLVRFLDKIAHKGWNIILHPDLIKKSDNWRHFGELLCIENMDVRKPVGRTFQEIDLIFNKLPDASLCFDIAHAYQVDSTMVESFKILNKYKSKIKQFHVSSLRSDSKHFSLNFDSIYSYSRFQEYFKTTIPIIIESPVKEKKEVLKELFLSSLLRDENFNSNFKRNNFQSHRTSFDYFRQKLEEFQVS